MVNWLGQTGQIFNPKTALQFYASHSAQNWNSGTLWGKGLAWGQDVLGGYVAFGTSTAPVSFQQAIWKTTFNLGSFFLPANIGAIKTLIGSGFFLPYHIADAWSTGNVIPLLLDSLSLTGSSVGLGAENIMSHTGFCSNAFWNEISSLQNFGKSVKEFNLVNSLSDTLIMGLSQASKKGGQNITNPLQPIVGSADSTSDNGLPYFQNLQDMWSPGSSITKFPPFPQDDGNGGGGGGGPGGVLFNKGATLSNIHNIYGAYWDDKKQQIIMVGSKPDNQHEIVMPHLNKDHMYVAMRSALAGQPLGVSIDPPKEYRDRRSRNENMPDGIPLIVSYLGNTEGTEFGSIMFEADRLMKNLGVGIDNETLQPVIAHVPGFKTHLDMLEPGRQTGSNWYRFWFITDKVELKRNSSGDALVFGDVKIRVLTETQYQSGVKAEVSEPTAEQFARHLSEHYDEYSKEFPVLAKLKELAKIAAVAKYIANNVPSLDIKKLLEYQPRKYNFIFSLDNTFEMDLNRRKVTRNLKKVFDKNKCRLSSEAKIEHVDDAAWEIKNIKGIYLVKKELGNINVYQTIHTPETTPGFTTWGRSIQVGNTVHTVGLSGGVDLAVDYEITTDNYATNNLKRDAEKNRPLETAMQWDFQDSLGKEKRAVGIRLGKLSDGYETSYCDLTLLQTNGMPIEIKRMYNSLNLNVGEFGIGWQLFVPFRLIIAPKSGKREEVLTAFEQGRDASSPPIFLINDSAGDCQHYQPINSTTKEGFETYYPVTACETTKKGVSFKYTPTNPIRKFTDSYEFKTDNGFIYHFDLQGHLTSFYNDRRKCVSYEYDGNFLSNVYDVDGVKIQFVRNQNDRIKQIKSSDGTIIEYHYNANGNLILVEDNHNRGSKYFYNSNRLLVEEKDLNDNILRRNSYDNLGRIINEREIEVNVGNGERVKKSYNKKYWLEMENDNRGNAVLYEYDRKGNLNQVVLSDKSGNKMMLTYDSANQLAKMANEFGDILDIKYDQDGNINQIQDSRGNKSEIVYNKEGVTTKMVDAKGNVWTESINTVTNQKVITDPIGESTVIDYNANGIDTVVSTDEKIKRVPAKDGYFIEYYYKNRKQSRIKLNDLKDIVEINNNKNCLQFDYNDTGSIQSIKDNYGEVCSLDYETEGDETVLTAKFQCFSKGELYGFKHKGDKIKKISEKTDEEKVCQLCNSLNPVDARFCVDCGKPFIKDFIRSCFNCGGEIEDDWEFCPLCGKTLEMDEKAAICPDCGEKVDEQWTICPVCEKPLRATKKFYQDGL